MPTRPGSETLRYALSLAALLAFCYTGFAQGTFRGVLINKMDSAVIPFAVLHAIEPDKSVLTDEQGNFEFPLPASVKEVTFDVSAIGYKGKVVYARTFGTIERVYVDIALNPLGEVAIKGLSAEDVVKKAVKLIPANYADSNYVAYAMYRQYQKVNGRYANLLEAQEATLFRVTKSASRIDAKEAIAFLQFRRVPYRYNQSNLLENNPVDLLAENPVYHLFDGSLNPGKFVDYKFNFDTTNKTRDYVIKYRSMAVCSEHHGWSDRIYWSRFFRGESFEEGRLVIDRSTFAIKSVERIATRYPNYVYDPFYPKNLVGGMKKYFVEFVKARLHCEYKEVNGKWYLSQLDHEYTDEFILPGFESYVDVITEAAEWSADSLSRYVPVELAGSFYDRPPLNSGYPYNKNFWDETEFPFYFYNRDSVYRDIGRAGPIEAQFYKGSENSTSNRPKRITLK